MDKITESLKKYLDSAGISHQTLFNSDGGLRGGYPTSTCFHREKGNIHRQCMSVVVNIYPEDHEFWIISSPMAVFDGEDIGDLRAYETKWNRIGMKNSLTVQEELGVTKPNRYCFQLTMSGFCDHDGLEETAWGKYIESIENNTYLAWREINEILGVDDGANEPCYCGKESSNRAGELMREVDSIFVKNGLKPPVYRKKDDGCDYVVKFIKRIE